MTDPATDGDSCANCGYPLHGLESRRCPECGYHNEDELARAETITWFQSWDGLLLRNPPACFWEHLGSRACQRVAIRRAVLGVVLPWMFLLLAAYAFSSVGVLNVYSRWIVDPNRPGVRVDPDSYAVELRPLSKRAPRPRTGFGFEIVRRSRFLSRPCWPIDALPLIVLPAIWVVVAQLIWAGMLQACSTHEAPLDPGRSPRWAVIGFLAPGATAAVAVMVVGVGTAAWWPSQEGDLEDLGTWWAAALTLYVVFGLRVAARLSSGAGHSTMAQYWMRALMLVGLWVIAHAWPMILVILFGP